MSKHQLLELLKQADEKTLKMLYLENREPFINFAKKFNISNDDVLDIYQDAFLVVRENAIDGKLKDLQCSINTYLFSIGKYMLLAKARKDGKLIHDFPIEKEDYNYKEITDDFLTETLNDQQKKLENAFESLGKKCREILTLFYYRGFTIDEITATLNHTSINVTKSQKSRCLKTLKEKANE